MSVSSFDPYEDMMANACQAITPDCIGQAVHTHHVRLRSQGGHDGPTLRVCAPCHRYIHENPAESYESGWLIRRVHDPQEDS